MTAGFTGAAQGISSLSFNPAGLSYQKHLEAAVGFSRLFSVPAGKTDLSVIGAGLVFPLRLAGKPEGLGFSWQRIMRESPPRFRDYKLSLGYGMGSVGDVLGARLDIGFAVDSFKRVLEETGDSVTVFGLDIGTKLTWGRHSLGISLLNANEPELNVPGIADIVPRTLRLGYAQEWQSWLAALDFATSGSTGSLGGYSIGAGVRWILWSGRHAVVNLRSGLSVGNKTNLFSAGATVRIAAGELFYSLAMPLEGPRRVSHNCGLAVYFGGRGPEDILGELIREGARERAELQNLIGKQEVFLDKLRKDLAAAEDKVRRLKIQLKSKKYEEEEPGKKIEWLLELQRDLKRNLKRVESRKRDLHRRMEVKKKQEAFDRDWREYTKLKASGSPDHLLADYLRKILEGHRGKGVDLGKAHREYLKLR